MARSMVKERDVGERAALGADLAAVVARLRRVLRRAVRRNAVDPLPPAASEVLMSVANRPSVGVTEVADDLRLAPNTVSTLVRQLVDRDLVVRSTDPADRRAARLDITPAARARIEAHRDRRAETMERALAQLEPAQREVLAVAVPLLHRLTDALEADQEESGEESE
jgi:DNA-binding MarR family transcriptional regulator